VGQVRRRDADPGIGHGEFGPPVHRSQRHDDAALPGELHRVAQQVHQHPAHAVGVRAHRGDVRQILQQLDFGFDQGLHRSGALRGQRLQVHRLDLDVRAAGLDLGQVQDVVDQGEQVVGAGLHVLQVAVLAFVELAPGLAQEDAGVPDDGVHRRAQVVGHARQEVGLELVGLLDLDVLLLDLLVLLLGLVGEILDLDELLVERLVGAGHAAGQEHGHGYQRDEHPVELGDIHLGLVDQRREVQREDAEAGADDPRPLFLPEHGLEEHD